MSTRRGVLDLTITTSGILIDGKGPIALDAISAAIGERAENHHLRVMSGPGVSIETEHKVLANVMTLGAQSISLGLSGPHEQGTTP